MPKNSKNRSKKGHQEAPGLGLGQGERQRERERGDSRERERERPKIGQERVPKHSLVSGRVPKRPPRGSRGAPETILGSFLVFFGRVFVFSHVFIAISISKSVFSHVFIAI